MTPELTPWGERLRERTEPLAPDDAEHGDAHAYLAGAMAATLERAAEIYDPDEGLPGSPLVDVDRCPDWALPWLAQLVGVVIPERDTPELARERIRAVAGWKRGTPGAMRAAASMYLTVDNPTVHFRERDPTGGDPPYCLEVVTRKDEVPETDLPLTNVLPNPSFELDTASWQVYAGPSRDPAVEARLDRLAGGAAAGNGYARVTRVTGEPHNLGLLYHLPAEYAGKTVHWSIAARGPGAKFLTVYIDAASAGSGYQSFSLQPEPALSEQWARHNLIWTLPADATGANVYAWTGCAVGEWIELDAAMLAVRDTPQVPVYGDGSYPGWAWSGAPHNSASIRTPTTVVRDALMRQKPAGILLTYRTVAGWDWQQVDVDYSAWSALDAQYSSWRRLVNKEPG